MPDAKASVSAAAVASAMPFLTGASVRVAQLVADDPSRVAQMTITELGEAARTSESTVVRTARALGYSGYSQLRLALSAEAARQHSDPEQPQALTADIAAEDALGDVLAKVEAAEETALRATLNHLDLAALEAAVDAITAARRVDIYGVNVSGLVATDLWQKLLRIGVMCHVHTDVHQALTSAVLLGSDDVAVAISHSGTTIDVLEPMRHAKHNGAATFALTSRFRSPLAGLADHVLLSAGWEEPLRPGAMASRSSQLLVADCLFIGVTQRNYNSALNSLNVTHETLASRNERNRRTRS